VLCGQRDGINGIQQLSVFRVKYKKFLASFGPLYQLSIRVHGKKKKTREEKRKQKEKNLSQE
jgi:hypothetical protein